MKIYSATLNVCKFVLSFWHADESRNLFFAQRIIPDSAKGNPFYLIARPHDRQKHSLGDRRLFPDSREKRNHNRADYRRKFRAHQAARAKAKVRAYRYGSKKSGIEIADLKRTFKSEGANYIYFASIQDLRGSEIVGGRFGKNDDVFNIKWDCVIIDEAHEGTTTELGEKVKSILFKPETGTKLLELSGTPFNILSNYDDEDSVFTWDYMMEQQAKKVH